MCVCVCVYVCVYVCVCVCVCVCVSFSILQFTHPSTTHITPSSIKVHTHTHTHTPGALSSPPKSAPPPHPPVVESNCVCMYVCVCAHVCVCRLRVHMTRLIRPHEPHEPVAGMHIKVGKTLNLHSPSKCHTPSPRGTHVHHACLVVHEFPPSPHLSHLLLITYLNLPFFNF